MGLLDNFDFEYLIAGKGPCESELLQIREELGLQSKAWTTRKQLVGRIGFENQVFLVRQAVVIGIGIAGLDPFGAVLLVSAITAGAGRTKVFTFAASVLTTSVLTGTALALAGNRMFESSGADTSSSSPAWAYLEMGTALLIAVWLARGLMPSGTEPAPPRRDIAQSTPAIAAAGAAFTLTSVLDPTFLATAAVVGPSGNIVVALLSFALWTLISQILLFSLVAAFNFGAHERAVDATRRWWQRHEMLLTTLLKIAGLLVVIALLVDAGYYFATDHYIYE